MMILRPLHDVDIIVRRDHSEIIATIRPGRAPLSGDSRRCASRHADLQRLAQRYTPRHLTSLNQRFACRVV